MPKIEFGSKEAADEFRAEWQEYLCPDDDRRLKTVTVVSDTPEHVIEQGDQQKSGDGGTPDEAVELSPEAAAATRTAINEIRQQYGQEPLEMEELGDRPITKEDIDA